jgi:3-methyl-2-oxobutanoate hydroxymethyltransferase
VNHDKITPERLLQWKQKGRRIPALTAYDYPLARLLDEAGVPVVLVGDSLGMVVLGLPDTTGVTLADMEHHLRAVARAQTRALVVGDLPYRSYDTPDAAVSHAQRLVAAGAEAVKAEGGRAILPQIQAILAAGIPFLGHLGMLPQHVLEEGGYRIKGRDPSQREALLADAHALQAAGAFGIVLELVTPPVAAELTQTLTIPTIGIGSGPHCDGQILVTPDLLGTFPWFTPKFVRPQLEGAALMTAAVQQWMRQVDTPPATDLPPH